MHGKDKLIVWFAAGESALYTFLIWVFGTGRIIPGFGQGEEAAVRSTVIILMIVAGLGFAHAKIQGQFETHGPEIKGWLVLHDFATSFAPAVMVLYCLVTTWPGAEPYRAWWPLLQLAILGIVAASIWSDIIPTLRRLKPAKDKKDPPPDQPKKAAEPAPKPAPIAEPSPPVAPDNVHPIGGTKQQQRPRFSEGKLLDRNGNRAKLLP